MASLLNMSGGSLLRKGSLLPSGYTQLEYIESTGTQYIDTGYIANQNSKVELSRQMTTTVGSRRFGSRVSSSVDAFMLTFGRGTDIGIGYDGQAISSSTIGFNIQIDTNKHVEILDKNKYYIDSVLKHTFNLSTFETPSTCAIFAGKDGGVVGGYSSMICYCCKIWDDGLLVRNFIPCKNPNNVVGMYDTVNGVFYSSPNGTAFVAGPEV